MTEPSSYDLIQDAMLQEHSQLIRPYFVEREGSEYSFPVVGQGISADQYRLMSLGQANGIIHGDNGVVNDSPNSTGYRYYLDSWPTTAETNQRNTLILRAGTSAEAIVEGFYHRLTEDMELDFPAVSSTTLYHVCLTYDPARESDANGPVQVRVYNTTPPTSGGRVHLLLHTVERRANQLLSAATKTRFRPYTAGLLSVQNRNQLPDPAEYPAGTVVVPSLDGHGLYVRRNGSREWADPISHKADKPGGWRSLGLSTNVLEPTGTIVGREVAEGLQIYAHLSTARAANGGYVFNISNSGYEFTRSWYDVCVGASGIVGSIYHLVGDPYNHSVRANINNRYLRFSTIIPGYVLRKV